MDSEERAKKGANYGHFSRRKFIAGAAGLSAGAMVGGQMPTVAYAAPGGGLHGAELRGMYLTSKNRLAEGRFGLMFKKLPAFAPPDAALDDLAGTMVEPDTSDTFLAKKGQNLFAGFTFIGQFIDHDITLDTTPLTQQQADPNATVNFRTPRYDLDSVYGGGPGNDPQFYDPGDKDKLLVTPNGNVMADGTDVLDMPRDGNGRAIIPDRRNDENLIIVQFHKAVAQFHNEIVKYVRAQGMRKEWVFEAARRLTRWHYQWAVIHDFLPRFVGEELVGTSGTVYKEVAGKSPVITLSYYKPTNKDGRPFMPVEFAVAAYRFGHSLIRPFYVLNDSTLKRGGVPVFGTDQTKLAFNLNGGRPIPVKPDSDPTKDLNLVMEWKNILPDLGNPDARPPRKIDSLLSIPLSNLPGSAVPPPDPTVQLAVRNNRRGKQVGLPSGQQVAKAMRVNVLSNTDLKLTDPRLGGEAPLWFYILKEAELLHDGQQLGPVGGRIMAETLVGLLQRDPNSYLYLDPSWKPTPPIANPTTGKFEFSDLLKFAGAAPSA
jgi:Animal haem peroxidase